jgi:hypothetical protein
LTFRFFQELVQILTVKTGMNTVQHGQEMGSAEQTQATCSSTAEKPVISADIVM